MKKISALFLSVVMLAVLLGGCSRPTLEGIESTGQEEVSSMENSEDSSNFNPTGYPIVNQPITFQPPS